MTDKTENKVSKSFCFTLNNYTEDEFETMKGWECKYLVMGKEVGEETGTPHIQGYVTFFKACRINSLKKLNKNIHWEPARSREAAANYCMKESKDVFVKDNRIQGQRSDLILLTNKLIDGVSVTEVAKEFPGDYIRYHAGIEKFAKLVQIKTENALYSLEACCKYTELSPLENYSNVLIGPPNCGKTQFALSHFSKPLLVTHIDDLLDLKEEHNGIVFDDMDFQHWHRTHCIQLVDHEQTRSIHCRYKNATIPKNTCKIFCCNEYPFPEDEAISRRVTVTEVSKR